LKTYGNRKAAARVTSKSDVLEGMHEFKQLEEDRKHWDKKAKTVVGEYNYRLAWIFKQTLIAIAPELSWCDTEPSWGNDYQARALSLLPWRMEKYSSKNPEEYTEILEKALGARP